MKKPKVLSKAQIEHQEFLQKMGASGIKRKKRSLRQANIFNQKVTNYSDDYHSNTGGASPEWARKEFKEESVKSNLESKKTLDEISRKEELIRAINMPVPRDLSAVDSREIDQKHLITPRPWVDVMNEVFEKPIDLKIDKEPPTFFLVHQKPNIDDEIAAIIAMEG